LSLPPGWCRKRMEFTTFSRKTVLAIFVAFGGVGWLDVWSRLRHAQVLSSPVSISTWLRDSLIVLPPVLLAIWLGVEFTQRLFKPANKAGRVMLDLLILGGLTAIAILLIQNNTRLGTGIGNDFSLKVSICKTLFLKASPFFKAFLDHFSSAQISRLYVSLTDGTSLLAGNTVIIALLMAFMNQNTEIVKTGADPMSRTVAPTSVETLQPERARQNLAWLACLLIAGTGLLHLITTPQEYAEAPYMGWLFLANFAGSVAALAGILRRKFGWGWMLGAFIAAGSILGYVQSRTFGMPGMEVEAWFDPIGISALIVEVLFLFIFYITKPWLLPDGRNRFSTWTASWSNPRILIPGMAATMLLVGFGAYQLGSLNAKSAHALPETVISAQTLEEEYGIKMELVALTAAGGLVDVRYRVLDPDKAVKLVTDGGIMPMIHIANSEIVLMPDAHMRTQKLIKDRMYFALIPNVQNIVKQGTVVTVVFGDIALEPMLAQ